MNTENTIKKNRDFKALIKEPFVIIMLIVLAIAGVWLVAELAKPAVIDETVVEEERLIGLDEQSRKVVISDHITDQEFQNHILKVQQEETRIDREDIVVEALTAIRETQKAINELDDNDIDNAMAAMERALGKLEVILAREPRAGLVPLDVSSQVSSLVADKSVIERDRAIVQRLVEEGNLQAARVLLDTLISEVRVTAMNIPLQTYPDAIRVAVRFLDDGKIDEARQALRLALNTLVITSRTIPIPLLNAELLVEKAASTVVDDKEQALEMLQEARERIEVAELLGYGQALPQSYVNLLDDLAAVEDAIGADEQSGELFTQLAETLEELRKEISE